MSTVVYTDDRDEPYFDIDAVSAGMSAIARTKTVIRKYEETGKITRTVSTLYRGRTAAGDKTWARWITTEYASLRKVNGGYAVLTGKTRRGVFSTRIFRENHVYGDASSAFQQMCRYFDTEYLQMRSEVYPLGATHYSLDEMLIQDPNFLRAFVGVTDHRELTIKLFGKSRYSRALEDAVYRAINVNNVALAWAFRGLVSTEQLIPLLQGARMPISSRGLSYLRPHLRILPSESAQRLAEQVYDPATTHCVTELVSVKPRSYDLELQMDNWSELYYTTHGQQVLAAALAPLNIALNEEIPLPEFIRGLHGFKTYGSDIKFVLPRTPVDLMKETHFTSTQMRNAVRIMQRGTQCRGVLKRDDQYLGTFQIDLDQRKLLTLLDAYSDALADEVQKDVIDAIEIFNITTFDYVGRAECLDD